MALKKFRPLTPGQRFKEVSSFEEVTKGNEPVKSLIAKISKSGGRNNTGKMTMRSLGGGHKKRYRIVDFKRDKHAIPAVVVAIEYDPNRNARLAQLNYADGEKRYIIAPNGLAVGAKVMSGKGATPEIGNCLFLSEVPLGTIIHNVELRPGEGASIARGAGTYAQLAAREGKFAVLRLPSGEQRMILVTCTAVIGSVSNPDHNLQSHGKAGRRRWMGRKPRVRPVAMNPVDHPMGGGEGRASGGHPRSRNGIPAKGYKTRYKKKASNKYIIERRKK